MCSAAVRSRPCPTSWRLGGVAVSLLLLALLPSACGGHYVVRGTHLYEQAHYVEAAEVFEQTEPRLASSSNAERARFGLYRGATFLKLGDVLHAARWLGYSRSILNSDPRALDAADAALLDTSLAAVGNVDPAAPARNDRSELATAPPIASDAAPTH